MGMLIAIREVVVRSVGVRHGLFNLTVGVGASAKAALLGKVMQLQINPHIGGHLDGRGRTRGVLRPPVAFAPCG